CHRRPAHHRARRRSCLPRRANRRSSSRRSPRRRYTRPRPCPRRAARSSWPRRPSTQSACPSLRLRPYLLLSERSWLAGPPRNVSCMTRASEAERRNRRGRRAGGREALVSLASPPRAAVDGRAREQHRRNRRRHHEEKRDQQRVHDGPAFYGRRHENRREQHAAGAERRAHRRRVHAREEVGQPHEAECPDGREEAGCDQQKCGGHRGPSRKLAHGSMTSPRSRNFAEATVPTKPNSAISKAMSKYADESERTPSTRRNSMPFTYSTSSAITRSCAAGPKNRRTLASNMASAMQSDANVTA